MSVIFLKFNLCSVVVVTKDLNCVSAIFFYINVCSAVATKDLNCVSVSFDKSVFCRCRYCCSCCYLKSLEQHSDLYKVKHITANMGNWLLSDKRFWF